MHGSRSRPALAYNRQRISMSTRQKIEAPRFGSADLRLPDELRGPLQAHLAELRKRYQARSWGGRVGFGRKPALLVIDLALWWTDSRSQSQGSDVDSVVEATCRLLRVARTAK